MKFSLSYTCFAAAQLLVLSSFTYPLTLTVNAYIVSGLPRQKQIAWLNEMTDNLCSTAPGQLSNQEVESAHDMIYAWAHMNDDPKTKHSSSRPSKKQSNRNKAAIDNTVECALRVESLVKRVVDERRAGNLEAAMTLEDYNLLLEGWAKSHAGMPAAERCEEILRGMQQDSDLKPSQDSFKSVLMAWRAASVATPTNLLVDDDIKYAAALRAQGVLEYMISLYASGKNSQALPDSDCFDICLQLWARSGHKDAPQQTEQLVIAMERLYHVTGLTKMQPRTTSFNAVLAAWSKSTSNKNAIQHMLDILRFMETHAALGDTAIQPDKVSYSTCISAIARSNADPTIAESLLDRVEAAEQASQEGVSDTILYNTVMNSWARSTKPGAYRKARSVLDRQMNHYHEFGVAKPDIYGFTSVLASCAMEPKEKSKAFKMALATFSQLRHSSTSLYDCTPNHVTYGTMMKCCARLLPPTQERTKWAKTIMAQCVEDGCVGDMVLSRFREAVTGDAFRQVVGVHGKRQRAEALPAEWTRNVDEKRECRKRYNNHSTSTIPQQNQRILNPADKRKNSRTGEV